MFIKQFFLKHLVKLKKSNYNSNIQILYYYLCSCAVLPIKFYRFFISPFLPRACKYHPSCSVYAIEAIMRHGLIKGFWLTFWRILRCNPWVDGGLDPVPPKGQRGV